MDTVSELQEPNADGVLVEPSFQADMTNKEDEAVKSLETSLNEIVEYDKEAVMKALSSTRADILDSGSYELNVTVAAESPELSCSRSASIEGDSTACDIHDTENSHLSISAL